MDYNYLKYKKILFLLICIILTQSCTKNDIANQDNDDATNEQVLWYKQPAKDWLEALPLGNGKLAAMVHGNTEKEKLQLNEESLWGGCPEDPIPENAKKHYSKFQNLNLEGKYSEALDYGMKNLAISPTSIRSYQTFGDLFISFENHQNGENYKRSLNLQTGISTVTYLINGKRFIRESFISTKYNTIFYHFKSLDNSLVSSEINFDRKTDIKQSVKDNSLIIEGQIFDDPNGYDDNPGGSGGGGYHTKFAGVIAVKNNSGQLLSSDKKLIIKEANEFTVMATAATDYNIDIMNFDRKIDPLSICTETIKKVSLLDYKTVKEEHISSHKAIMNRVKFNITANEVDSIPTDVRLKNLKVKKEDKHLTELFFQYGRYLLLSSSGGNAVLPANLQGIWNKEMWAPWDADFHLNINLQMNYWPAEICNLSETTKPLSVFIKNLSENGKVTASKFLDTDGWMAHHVSNPFGRTTASGSTRHSQVNNGYCFPLAGAWMSMTLWRHYEFTQDKTYLNDVAYPVLSGAANFILDFLKENEKGELVTAPSYSPENDYVHPVTGKQLKNTIAAAIDIQIIRDVFDACLQSEALLNKETALTKSIHKALKKLPKNKIGKNGTIQEWYEDYEEIEVGHRHISHMYALYPSNQINQNTPKLYEAAKKTLARRLSGGGGQTGWSRAWMINFYARLFDGDKSNKHLCKLLETQLSSNLFDLIGSKSTIFQIDGNLGATAGIAEMLLQSQEKNTIRVLPALPETWKDGSVIGLKARGGVTVGIYWENNELTKVVLSSKFNQEFNLVYKDEIHPVKLTKGENYIYDPNEL